ncbi:MAG: ABC transporter transmembrane domain-containing protein [Pirellulaceae bacterium]|nr:ABC transporter transmembrane domain-containing protein [Pirellulaceae bacterium]
MSASPPSSPNAKNNPLEGIELRLRQGELVLESLTIDLDDELHYEKSLIVLTTLRVIALPANTTELSKAHAKPAEWTLTDIVAARTVEQFGIGSLEILGENRLLKRWHFTAGEFTAAAQLARGIQSRTQGALVATEPTVTVCPSCGATLPPGELVCKICKPAAQLPPTRSLLRLLPFARPYVGMIVLGFVLTIAGTLASLAPPYIAITLIDDVLFPAEGRPEAFQTSLFIQCIAGMVVSALLAWVLRWARTYVLAWVGERVAADLRSQTYAHLQSLSLEFFGGKRTGDLMSRISSDTDKLNNYLTITLLDFATDILMIAMTAAILLWLNPWLAVITLLPLPAIAWLTNSVRKRLRLGFALGYRMWGEMTSVLADTIPGIRVVKAFAQEGREVARFRKVNQHVRDVNNRVNRVWSFFDPLIGLLTDSGNILIWIVGAWFITGGTIRVGALQAFLVYIGRFYVRFDSMSRMLAATQRAAAAAHRVFEILDRVPSVAEPKEPVHPGRVEGKIEIRDVTFQYGTRQVIKGVSLTVEPGEMIGLVGPSGAGKSTLVNLVCRFYDVVSGSITVDGVDVRSFPIEEYRRNIGVVLQEPFLFFGTVAENIAYARPEATREEIIAAAKSARAHEFILRLPEGYDSIVGERGQSLSGGERQRISIARAILSDPRILILDEATSSVDTQTEREIQAALDILSRGRTTIAIAHRLSTLRGASRIIVMEDGQIVEAGTHAELLQRPGAYSRLHEAQFNPPATEESSAAQFDATPASRA